MRSDICPWTLSVPRSSQFSLSYTLKKQIMSVNKYLCIFSHQMENIVYVFTVLHVSVKLVACEFSWKMKTQKQRPENKKPLLFFSFSYFLYLPQIVVNFVLIFRLRSIKVVVFQSSFSCFRSLVFVLGGLCFHNNRGNRGMTRIKRTDSKRFVPSSCKYNSPGISHLLVTVVFFFLEIFIFSHSTLHRP